MLLEPASGAGNETTPVVDDVNCIDYVDHRTVKKGEIYFVDNCLMCRCGDAEVACQRIWCLQPTHCNGVLTKDPRNCCDVCTPSVILNGSVDHAGPSLKLGGMTVTFLILVSTVFFVLHRLRKKRLLITVRRCRSLDDVDMRRYRNFENTQCPTSAQPIRSRYPELNSGYVDPPPPYFTAIRQPVDVAVYAVPPPPYFPATTATTANNLARSRSIGHSSDLSVPKGRPFLQSCHSWPDLHDTKAIKWPPLLARNVSDQAVHAYLTSADRSYSTSISDVQTSSCSSTSCSSGCDCRSFSSDDPPSVCFAGSANLGRPVTCPQ